MLNKNGFVKGFELKQPIPLPLITVVLLLAPLQYNMSCYEMLLTFDVVVLHMVINCKWQEKVKLK